MKFSRHPAGPASLFPLPCVPIEAMMLYDDWPSYPMTCGAQFTFAGRVNSEIFQQAVAAALLRHPLFSAHIANVGYHRWAWVHADRRPVVKWLGTEEPYDFARCEPFDLEREVGLRIWVQELSQETRMFFEFHHACCDGAGGLAFVEDVLGMYADALSRGAVDSQALPPIAPELLHRRGCFDGHAPSLAARVRTTAGHVGSTARLLAQSPAALAHQGELNLPDRVSWRPHRFVSRRFGRATLAALRTRAAACGATLNDILLRDLFLCLQDWNQQRQATQMPYRVVVPVNLRTRADLSMPATNRLSYSFLTRGGRQLASADHLLRSIQQETASARRARFSLGLLAKLSLLQRTRIAYPWVFSMNRCFATAVFSNLGDPTRRFRIRFPRENGLLRVGNLLLTDFAGTTALRPRTHAGFFFNTYANQLTISTRFDPVYFTVSDALTFLDQLTERVAERATPAAVPVSRAA